MDGLICKYGLICSYFTQVILGKKTDGERPCSQKAQQGRVNTAILLQEFRSVSRVGAGGEKSFILSGNYIAPKTK